jgi:hypothetical protein
MENDIITLQESPEYLLRAEKIRGKWWLETIERSTGRTWIIYCDTKKHARACFDRMSFADIMHWLKELKVEPVKMYKAGVL